MPTTSAVTFRGAYPIGDSDPRRMPVRDLDTALSFYEEHVGLIVEARTDAPHRAAQLRRDQVVLGLVEDGRDPEQHSCYLDVDDVAAAHRAFRARDLDVSDLRIDVHDGKSYRVFFLRAPDGLCYCIGQPV